jgi:site-specific DNA-methyltransferase (adenine-specific)
LKHIFLEDYKKFLSRIDKDSIDLICIDPPYEINYTAWDSKILDWDFLFRLFYKILRSSGNLIIFNGWSNVIDLIRINYLFKLENWIIWDRVKGRGAKRNFTSTREDILWFTKSDKYTFNKEFSNIPKKTKGMGLKNGQLNRSLSNVWTDISPVAPMSKQYNGYPTQKPIELMRRIVRIFSNPDDLVLDCFMGSGSTIEACILENRKYLGCDNNKKAHKICFERIKNINILDKYYTS